ncbi:MAG: hypothetical protein DI535_05060 [Citrobacter freundii]|nr:MAG: hypothetical protein DI535_05060 [Citrobacter freundii]
MTTKLTLTIEQDVIETAKRYARKKGRSLSDLVESYLKTLSGAEGKAEELSPKVKRMVGAIRLPDDFDYKESLRKGIEQKHGK